MTPRDREFVDALNLRLGAEVVMSASIGRNRDGLLWVMSAMRDGRACELHVRPPLDVESVAERIDRWRRGE